MFQLPEGDIDHWRQRLRDSPPSVVLREIAERYSVGRSALGLVLPDLGNGVYTPHVQAIWTWDLANRNSGLTDQQLDESLRDVDF